MRLAFFSPFPPKRTGVAAYSRALVDALRATVEVTAFDFDNPELIANDTNAVDAATHPEHLARLDEWDACIFSLGNNPSFHLPILQALERTGGIVLLHDSVLYFLLAGLPDGAFYRHFCEEYGVHRSNEINELRSVSVDRNLLRYPFPERYPFLRSALRKATGVIVHSRFAADLVRAAVPEIPVYVIPILSSSLIQPPNSAARAAELRNTVLQRPSQLLLGSFGFLGPTKRLAAVAQALARLPPTVDFHFVVVGDGPSPISDFETAGIRERVTHLPYVSDSDFDAWISATDVVINLRFPSMGESSATLTHAMGLGRVCVVTDHGSFAEYPNGTVAKIPVGEPEISVLVETLQRLASSPDLRDTIGRQAKDLVLRERSPQAVAAQLKAIIECRVREGAHRSIINTRVEPHAAASVRDQLHSSILNRLPAHLRSPFVESARSLPSRMHIVLTPEEIRCAFRILLEREPDPENEIPGVIKNIGTLGALRNAILGSEEYFSRFGGPPPSFQPQHKSR